MLFRRLLLYVIFLAICSCQKEVDDPSPSNGTEDDDTAVFTLQSLHVLGNYLVDSALTSEHKLNLSLHVTETGEYTATSGNVKGIKFSDEGMIFDTGFVELSVPATGTPMETGTVDFVLTINGQTFLFQVNIHEAVVETGELVNAPPGWLATQYDTYGIFDYVRTFTKYQPGTTVIRRIESNYHPTIDITYNSKNLIYESAHYYEGQAKSIYRFVYDENDRVSKIITMGADNQFSIEDQIFTWNEDGTPHTRSDYPNHILEEYVYTDGNLTLFPGAGDTRITYDNRTNHFKDIYPQYFFLDQLTLYGDYDLAAALYFSKNYPVTYGNYTITVTEDANGRPSTISYDGQIKYGYGYN
jgi:hypothetical protein